MSRWLRQLFRFNIDSSGSNYDHWTRSQLISQIRTLENQLKKHTGEPPRLTQGRPFDITKYEQQRIALKVAYLGWRYSGFATQGDEIAVPTVEDQLFKAFESCKLIASPDQCNFTRCGRTDKGVSGLGQVVALNVRSNKKKGSTDTISYVETLNKLLPDDIRVLAWASVKPTFNARFDCKSRTYKYFFEKGTLDIDLMRRAAEYMIGTHDFRNFCRLDPSKNITNYERQILALDIKPVVGDFYEVELKGTAFLWHQVRCIMSVLFLVGQRLEEPEVVQSLLDVNQVPARPNYPMASEIPLMLYDCEFENIEWNYANNNVSEIHLPTPLRTFYHLHELWSSYMIKGLLYKTCLDTLKGFPLSDVRNLDDYKRSYEDKQRVVVLGGGKTIKSKNYKKLLARPQADSDQVKKEKYRLKQLNKNPNF